MESSEYGQPHGRLILVRHGQSEWNRANLFTGWVDCDLTEQGIAEAREAGRLLAAEGLKVDEVHTSFLRRAIRSAVLMLSTLNQCWVPVEKHPNLNEQHSGMLTGQNKRDLAQVHGVEQVMAWRRKYDVPPPPAVGRLQSAIANDARYQGLVRPPSSESLAMVCKRLDPLWDETLRPALEQGRTVMVVSHGNTLRALVKRVEGLGEEDVFYLDLPTATPLLYEFDASMQHIQEHGYWGDRRGIVRHGRYLVDMVRVRAAQDAMRMQVSQNIAFNINHDAGSKMIEAAYTAQKPGRTLAEIDGEGYTVRQTPPTYFFQESLRLAVQAKTDLEEAKKQRWSKNKIAGQKKRVRCALVLLRHGQSTYNKDKLFTGWADPDLTNRGREEARLAGQLLRATGIERVHCVYTSLLKRAVKTAWLALDEMELTWTPVRHTWRLNERNYGALQDRDKAECVERYGLKQVQKWRRGYSERPPPWTDAQLDEALDRRYDAACLESPAFPPRSESLEDCLARLMPFVRDELQPGMDSAVTAALAEEVETENEYQVPTVLVVASENVLRALVMHLEGLTEERVPLIDVPYAVPLVYQLDSSLSPIPTPWAEAPLSKGWYLGDPDKVRAVQEEIKSDLPPSDDPDETCLVSLSDSAEEEEREEWQC